MPYQFDPNDLYGLAFRMGAETRKKGNELFFHWCPYCQGGGHDQNTFSVNLETGMFKCFRSSCGKQGHFVQMARDFGYSLNMGLEIKRYRELPQRPLQVKDEAVEYMQGRGIGEKIVRQYHITVRKDNSKVLVFPFYDETGILRFVKYRKTDFDRSRDKNKEWSEKGTMPILFGMNQCEGFDRLILTEGQIDSLSLAQAGIKNAVSVPNGAKGFTWMENCWEWISKFKEVVVFGDCEGGKITLVDEVSRRLTCPVKVVRQADYLGEKDANDILRKYGEGALRDAVEQAELVAVSHVKRLADVQAVDLQTLPHIRTGIPVLDRVIGGLYFGQLILLTGKRGEGKSTLMGQMIAEALNQDFKVLAYSGELPDYHFKRWLDLQLAGPQHLNVRYNSYNDPVYSIDEETVSKLNQWYYNKAYLYDNHAMDDGDEYESLLQTVEKAVCRYGIQLVCIDNLMTAIDISSAENQYVQQSQFVRALKQMAVKHNIAIVLVAHPKKTQGDVSDNDAVSGSSDITNRADLVMSYAKAPEETPGGKILVLKNRLTGKLALKDNAVTVLYDEPSKRIYAASGDANYRYMWEENRISCDEMFEDLPF